VVTVTDIGLDADLFRRAYPHWPHPEPDRSTVMPKNPAPQVISRLLKAAGFDRSEVLSRAALRQTYTTGFRVRASDIELYVSWRRERLDPDAARPSGKQAERDKATALEMAGRYAEAISAAGWQAEVIHLAGPLVRVTAKEG
jgi:hypothetical protein